MNSTWRALGVGLSLLTALPIAAAADGLTVLQINDTYKIEGLEGGRVGGMARVRTLRRELEEQGRDVVVVHAGDLLFPSVMSKYLDGRAMVAALDRLDGSDAFDDRLFVTFGNHEFDSRDWRVLFARLAESRFTWLSADLAYRLDGMAAAVPFAGHAPNVVATKLVEAGGVRLGLFGLTLPADPRPWAVYADFEQRVAAAERAVAELRARGAELVLAVTHQDLADDERLAERVPGIDWIAGGHEHIAFERHVGRTGITKADADARSIVRLDVERGDSGLRIEPHLVQADASIEPDADMLGLVASWLVRLEEAVRERTGRSLMDVVATTEHALEGVEPAIRGRETALGDFLADTLRARLGTDVALINGGAIRVNDDVPAGGNIRVYELEGIFYYDNRPVAFEVSGRELLGLLRISVSGATLGHGRFWQVSGLRFRYHRATSAKGETTRVDAGEVEIRAPDGGWRPLELDRRYSVASLDYEWENGCRDGYPLLAKGCGGTSPPLVETSNSRAATPLSWRQLTEAAIAALPGHRITTACDGRIDVVEEPTASGD